MKAKVYLYLIQNECNGCVDDQVIMFSEYQNAKKQLLSDVESNKFLESCTEEVHYDKDVNKRERLPRVENWPFEHPLLYIRTFSNGGNHAPCSRTVRAIFEKELN